MRSPTFRLVGRLALAAALVCVAGATAAIAGGGRRALACRPLPLDSAYTTRVEAALAARQDVWGNELLRSAAGPTYDGVRRYLHPLLLVGKPAGLGPLRLTDSGVYYLPFGQPRSPTGAGAVQLHVADGSQVVSDTVEGPRLSVDVGAAGDERYGSCLARLEPPRLYDGYLPVLETSYTDADGVRYRQESFAARLPRTRGLASFVRIAVDPRGSRRGLARVRLTPSPRLRRVGNRLRQGRATRLVFSRGGRFDGRSLLYVARRPRIVYLAWLHEPRRLRQVELGRRLYDRAKLSLVSYWTRRLALGGEVVVPEQRVYDAERNLLIQNMLLSWRYSLGNFYERFSWELVDVAETMGAYGYRGIERAILDQTRRADTYFPNRASGERMTGAADYYRRFGDRTFVEALTPAFRAAMASCERQLGASRFGLLRRERYGSDIARGIYGLHAQVLALQGLKAMAGVWAQTGHPRLAFRATQVAERLDAGLRAAVAAAATRLPDGSLFVPVSLVDGKERPYDALTSSKRGSYWNLVMPYVLGSGFFRPHSSEADGLLRYMLSHGSRFLGLVRFQPHTGVLNPGYQRPGSDDVYGINVARFLADEDEPDQLVLSLYGKLAAGMTENTFVAGEGATIAPVGGQFYRAMHRPPNSANNAFFLETLRLALVHETTDAAGTPQGLELAFSTPRAWLQPGKRIEVRRLRTSFGALSYSIDAGASALRVTLDVPEGLATKTLRLRLRLPPGQRIGRAVDGADRTAVAQGETLDLSGRTGRIELVVARTTLPRG